jgi:hypothetical protein
MADAGVFNLLQPVAAQRGSPTDLGRRACQLGPAGLLQRHLGGGSGNRLGRDGAPGRMSFFDLFELTAIFLFPFLTVFVGHKAVSIPKGAGGCLDRFFSHRLQIHRAGLCWSIQIPDGSMIRSER